MKKLAFKRVISFVLSMAMSISVVPDLYLPLHAEDVRNSIVSDSTDEAVEESIQKNIEDYRTDETPPDDLLILSQQTNLFSTLYSTDLDNDKKTLLIEDTLPWSSNANCTVLNSLTIPYNKISTQDFFDEDLTQYKLIILANDQYITSYNEYYLFQTQLENFANNGGTVLYGACDGGWANSYMDTQLPGGVTKGNSNEYYNYICNSENPIVTCELSDGIPLTDSMLYSNYCSHVYFNEDSLPANTDVILRETSCNRPTLIEYGVGEGKIIMSGLTWEHNYSYKDGFGKHSLDDLFLYALQLSNELQESQTETEESYPYVIFSGNQNKDLILQGWKSNMYGSIYTGSNFIYNGTELFVGGDIDACKAISLNGWKKEVGNINEESDTIAMPDWDKSILSKDENLITQPQDLYYYQDTTLIDQSIYTKGNIQVNGTNFVGTCYIIADGNITLNIQNFNADTKIVLYSRNGNITINGSTLNICSFIYAPHGNVTINAYDTTINGRIYCDNFTYYGSILNVKGSSDDFDLVKDTQNISKTYTTTSDFNEGTKTDINDSIEDQISISKVTEYPINAENTYGKSETGNGVSVTAKTEQSKTDDTTNVDAKFSLEGYGSNDDESDGVDLVILVDESGSMVSSRMTSAKAAAEEVVSEMRSNDRCAIVGFTYSFNNYCDLTSNQEELLSAISNYRASGGTNIANGINNAVNIFDEQSANREKIIILLSDGEDSSNSSVAATSAYENGIRIFALMIGTGTLQMQQIAINSNGVYKNAPTSDEIADIMESFASEVFNTAGRQVTFKTTITDSSLIDVDAISPAPDNITQTDNGTVLEWYFDKIEFEQIESIDLPFEGIKSDTGKYIKLTENTSLVYYNKSGDPVVTYVDDICIPVESCKESAEFSAIYDSENEDTEWGRVFWNGTLYGDSDISVTTCTSDNGVDFSEPVEVENNIDLSELNGRYIKIIVSMTSSSDGQSPVLYDITVEESKCDKKNIDNSSPVVVIDSEETVKQNVPLRIYADISDDCFIDKLSVQWSCNNEESTILNENALITSIIFNSTGTYTLSCMVSDGENSIEITKDIIVTDGDEYSSIGTGTVEAIKPEINVDLPEYANTKQTINAHIDNLNSSEIAWYSVIANDKTAITVDSDNNFTLVMPSYNYTYNVVVRAFDWAGNSDVKEYSITVDSTVPTITITPNADSVEINSDAYFTITKTVETKIDNIIYKLNGEEVQLDEDNKYILNTEKTGEYILSAELTTTYGSSITAESKIQVVDSDTEPPVVTLHFDKDIYYEGDSAVITVTATDNDSIDKIEFFYNDILMELDSNNSVSIESIDMAENNIVVNAYDKTGNIGTAQYTLTPEKTLDTTNPELKIATDKESYFTGETIKIFVTSSDDSGEVTTIATLNDNEIILTEGTAEYVTESAGSVKIYAKATDPSENFTDCEITVEVIDVPDVDNPVVNIATDKDTYFEKDNILITISATDNIGVEKIVLTIDGNEVSLTDNTYTLENAENKSYEISATAYDKAGNYSTSTLSLPVNEALAPEITTLFDKESYTEGDSLELLVTAQGQCEISSLVVKVNDEEVTLDDSGKYSMDNLVAGDYIFTVTATDIKGLTAESAKAITVLPVDLTDYRLMGEIQGLVEFGETAELKVTATDEVDKSTIAVTLDGEVISLSESLTYEFVGNELFNHTFVITASALSGEVITKEVTVNVVDTVCPEMTMTFDKEMYDSGDDIVVTVIATDNVAIKRVEFTYDGKEYSIDENNQVTIPSATIETHAVVANAWDTFGNCITLSSAFIAVYIEDTGEYVIKNEEDVDNEEIVSTTYSPKDGQTITAPTSIVGTAGGTEFTKYVLQYAPACTTDFTTITESTEPVNAGVLGKFDPTLLNNGLYTIRLTVYSDTGSTVTDSVVSVEGQMKIGNFSMAFQDMDFNVAGLPLTVIRSYDSRNKNTSDDFGYGWDMSTSGVTINESCSMSKFWKETVVSGSWMDKYYVDETRAHIVTINYGNGQTDKFKAAIKNPDCYSQPGIGVTIYFTAQDGTTSTLQALGADELIYNNGYLYDYYIDLINITRYKLTKQDGTIYIINKNTGVESITDPNGNKITFSTSGITHSDGKSITFNRDSENRITSIVSPSDKTVLYTYDSNGDLSSVTDILGETTTFVYENHYLTEIIDPRGIKVSKNIYDDDGRLIKTIDSDGNEITYDHDVDGREEKITDRNGYTTRYIYDSYGNILSQTDPMGHTIKNTYDDNGNLATKTDAMGNITNYNYDSSGNMLSYSDSQGHTVTNTYSTKGMLTSINAMGINAMSVTYDSKGNTTSTTDALGNDIDYTYDTKGELTSVTDEIGAYMNMTYDSNGNVVSATNGAGTTAQFTYDSDGNCASKTLNFTSDGISKTVTEKYFYDNAGNMIKIIDSDGNVTTTNYNTMGKISSATDEKGRQTTYQYDDFGNIIKINYPDGTSESFTYDREGHNLTATDRVGRTVTMKYDKIGNLLSKTYSNGATTSYTYNANYNLSSETSASGGTTTYEYDSIGRNTAIIDANGNTTSFSYNTYSQLDTMTDAKGNVYTYSYDLNGNRTKTTFPDNSSVSSTFDARGRITSETDQHGYTKTYTYDGADRLTSVTDALNNTTRYTYDEVGNLTAITDANGNVTSYTYDNFGRVIKTTNALGNTAETTYDVSGNILTSTDFGGHLTTFAYDSFDRIITKTTADGEITFTYTADGKLSTVTDSTGTTEYYYNNMDGLSKVIYPDANYVSYDYDTAGRLTKLTTAFGETSYQYDTLDRITKVIDRNGYATVYEYDANGNRTAVKYANGITVSYEYDKLNRLICEETIDKDLNVVAKYVYTLGASGERTRVEELDRTVDYTYDKLYRLTSETITEGENVTVYTYGYDAVSNRILKTVDGEETVYKYNDLNQLISENDTTYEYDDAGNLIRMIAPTKSALYVYNAENKLIKATIQSENTVVVEEYTYDYQGNRTSKKTSCNGNVEYVEYLNDNSGLKNVLVEINADGTEKCYYTIGADLISQEIGSKVYTYLYDGHGTVRALANESGNITDTYSYDAFGNLLKSTGNTSNSYLYCGEQFDSTTGLYYLRARYMDTNTGRFISQDTYAGSTSDPVSLHKYLYANSNPVMYSDTSGNSVENDTYYYQQAWLSIQDAQEYIRQLLATSTNEAAHNAEVIKIGMELIHQLTMTAVEYAIASFLEPYVGPEFARTIANGIVTAIDMSLKGRNNHIDDSCGFTSTDSTEKYYRTMSKEDYDYLQLTGEIHPSNETFISPTKEYSQKYDGVLVEFTVNSGTTSSLADIGLKDDAPATNLAYPNMPFVKGVKGWTTNNALFKTENKQINIGLGKGKALEIFNINIIGYTKLN